MKILLTNDDGIEAHGIRAVGKELCKIADVYVVAPEVERSTIGHALTLHKPVRAIPVRFQGAKKAWKILGTPSDCVKLGAKFLIKEKIDLIISGINRGANLGTDIFYSGTVAAAIEGTIIGIPSIAVSYCKNKRPYDYKAGAKFIARLAPMIHNFKLPKGNLLNINIPIKDKIAGVKVTRLGVRRYEDDIQERFDPVGNPYYWLQSENITDEKSGKNDTDSDAIEAGFISITPIHYDLTNYTILKRLRKLKI
ncbi:MAG: 5'/3'-nucleotidase SurE [bacterium]